MTSIFKFGFSLFSFSFFSIVIIAQINPNFKPIPANAGVNNPNAVFARNINYDNIDPERQLFHLFLPDTSGTFPLIVYIHGGGFTGGNPGVVFENLERREEIKFFLENGFAYASFGYRIIESNGPDTVGVIKSLTDAKRALQFVRYYADDLHINSNKIALIGSSAGSGTSLWLGTRSDMADPNAEDPVLSESTRVCAVVANGSQATYDIYKWETEIYQNYDDEGNDYTLDSMANLLSFERLSNFYGGLDSLYQIVYDSAFIQYREDVDMLYHMSSDDPPIFIKSRSKAELPGEDLFHHSFHGRELNATALAADIPEVKAYIPALDINTTDGETTNEFLLRQVNACGNVTKVITEKVVANPVFTIYPNPAKTHFSIHLLDNDIKALEIFSLAGRLIQKQQYNLTNPVNIPVASFTPGMYIVRITSEEGNKFSKKLIVE